jgi:redox-sensing transcriptional repressor
MDGAPKTGTTLAHVKSSIPAATVSRLPIYLRCLVDLSEHRTTCSSEQLAATAGVNSAQVRKDLSYLGTHGVRGVGYSIAELRQQLRRALGLNKGYSVAIAGAGNLGSALANYGGFEAWGFEVVAIFDADPAKIGTSLGGHVVQPVDELEATVRDCGVDIGIVATPASAAQDVADGFVAAEVRSILNFAPTVLHTPEWVETRRMDVSTELQILTYHLQLTAERV